MSDNSTSIIFYTKFLSLSGLYTLSFSVEDSKNTNNNFPSGSSLTVARHVFSEAYSPTHHLLAFFSLVMEFISLSVSINGRQRLSLLQLELAIMTCPEDQFEIPFNGSVFLQIQ